MKTAVDQSGATIHIGDTVTTPSGRKITVQGVVANAFKAADCTKDRAISSEAAAVTADSSGAADGDTVIWGT